MPDDQDPLSWDLDSAISLLKALRCPKYDPSAAPGSLPPPAQHDVSDEQAGHSLGDFSTLWDFLQRPQASANQQVSNRVNDEVGNPEDSELFKYKVNDESVAEVEVNPVNKGVRWRDEADGDELEDNLSTSKVTAAYIRNKKRAERRARAKERAEKLAAQLQQKSTSDTTDLESGEELESLRRSPDRRAVIDDILGRPRPAVRDTYSPPTSPSPPKSLTRTPKKTWPTSNPFLWTAPGVPSPSHRTVVTPRDGLSPRARKQALITALMRHYPEEKKYLKNSGLLEPAFTPLNVSKIGIHVFVDISNISIGFHDCLKLARGMPRETRLKRVPLCFHNFSLVLERGRPAAKRVLVGSDKYAAIEQAKSLGFETNILERVHKAKELTPRQKKYLSAGETSGSETNTTFPKNTPAAEKWVEQAVDEILHLKILESLIDAERPSTIVLATGDAAEAEYSGGFLRMVERALEKGWSVELVSFRLNTSSLYKRKEFRAKWGPMFKWIELDPFVEFLINEEDADQD
ncbi:hypothetical protein HRR83_007355 [Exophiala dermatitidis]|uniref:NYN domain-containing protein n=1 Tax=Exophiala dermatitidis (strain ATCC 34100 / CBS 525.76 / NIH/UT8656) TaxID=858893 RepID=H6C1U6_EXODN|nr:uncharacterized protein HMPREF1120_06638 [Exophiala dermatitidis NIH/UT8656]KAJ4510329.1 hypothetical protein HRR74_006801 [Exophiala dermatitidis]EHY58633.1 hypothetical protein HMPREF1120_06638 [Exophiala dermatitidis NIH/UT8656]KAJ4510736.1 hypothetical protein HRR73_006808 [Exophiala dermatitidis]KAJ4536006.1 hypothetical protein HRR77_007452 [Exophiala dermatitidis]KAJ4571021.1 hypothetical protein HRR79_003936 [Exophiala dermatitidis]